MSKKPPRRRDPIGADEDSRPGKPTLPIRANVEPGIASAWRRACQQHGMGLNEAMERLMRWFTAQDQTTQQFFLGVVPAELRLAVTSHVIGSLLDWAIRSTDMPEESASKIGASEVDRLYEVARLYHVTFPPSRRPDGSVEQVTKTYAKSGENPEDAANRRRSAKDAPGESAA
jgi:hypothetical protein